MTACELYVKVSNYSMHVVVPIGLEAEGGLEGAREGNRVGPSCNVEDKARFTVLQFSACSLLVFSPSYNQISMQSAYSSEDSLTTPYSTP